MFLVRQAIHEHLATNDNSPGIEDRLAKYKKKDDNNFFEDSIFGNFRFSQDPVTGEK